MAKRLGIDEAVVYTLTVWTAKITPSGQKVRRLFLCCVH